MSEEQIGQDVWTSPGGRSYVSHDLIDKIKEFPVSTVVVHCDEKFDVSPLDFYAECPECKVRIKLRSFSGDSELEDAFDAFAEWVMQPGGLAVIERRYKEIKADSN